MPRLDCITIHPHDLQQVLDILEIKNHPSDMVRIVDGGNKIIVRDSNDMHIFSIEKTVPVKS